MDWKEVGEMVICLIFAVIELFLGILTILLLLVFGIEGIDNPHHGKKPV